MKRWWLLFVIIILVSMGLANAAYVDNTVNEEIDDNAEADVIVVMKQPGFRTAARRDALDTMQLKRAGKKDYDFSLKRKHKVLNAFSGRVTKKGLEKLRNNPDVEAVYYDEVFEVFLDVSVPLINTTKVWNTSINGTNVTGAGETVCIIDTGVDYRHINLGNCTEVEFLAGNCSKVLSGYDFVNDDNNPVDDQGHGSHVAGIVASNDTTYKGVAPDSQIVAIKVCNNASSATCASSDIISGIDWCVANASIFNISVITMSLGGGRYYSNCDASVVAIAANNAVANGIFVTASTGNNAYSDSFASPACASDVTSVGGSNDADGMYSNSNTASFLDVLAPGTDINSVDYDGDFVEYSGTSMAAPHVAGAGLLLFQYVKLKNGTTLQPLEIRTALTETGRLIQDPKNSLYFPRIDVFRALKYLNNTAPNITGYYPPTNFSVIEPSNQTFNVTYSDTDGDNVAINWLLNGTVQVNQTNSTSFNFTGNYSTAGNYTVMVNVSDGYEYNTIIWNMQVNNTNVAPNITAYYPTDANFSIIEPSNQTFNITYSDVDGDDLVVYWLLNGSSVGNGTDYNFTGNYSSTGLYNVTASVSDSEYNTTTQWLMTVNNTNRAPYYTTLFNVTVNETQIVNVSGINATDPDNDSLSINYSSYINSSGLWKTNNADVGQYEITVNVTDGALMVKRNITVIVVNVDSDDDGIPDWNETDSDDDGINDTLDFIKGNISHVFGGLNLTLEVSGSTNISKEYNGLQNFSIKENNSLMVEFAFNLSNESIIDFNNVSVKRSQNGSLLVYGLNLFGGTKTVYLDNFSNSQGVCIRDQSTKFMSEMSSDCSGSDMFVTCPGTLSSYNCSINGSRYAISGLNHSAVMQSNDTVMPKIESIAASTSGSTTVTVSLTLITNENATCRYNTADINYSLMTSMTDAITSHSTSISYTSDTVISYYFRCNDSYGNFMNFSNSTSVTVDVTDSNTGSSGGGGGGGGGSTKPKQESAKYFYTAVAEGMNIKVEPKRTGVAVKSLELKFKEDATDVEIAIESVAERPVSFNPQGETFGYLSMDVEGATSFDGIVIFSVNKSWVDQKGDKEDVVLMHFKLGNWNEVETTYMGVLGDKYEYQANLDSFSYFAISLVKAEEPPVVEEVIENITVENVTDVKQDIEADVYEIHTDDINETVEPVIEEDVVEEPDYVAAFVVISVAVIIILSYLILKKSKKKN